MLNLGKYERQYWQGVTFGETKDKPLTEQALYEYLAFILSSTAPSRCAGLAHLHGKKGKALVHIGAVDAPVTIAEIDCRGGRVCQAEAERAARSRAGSGRWVSMILCLRPRKTRA